MLRIRTIIILVTIAAAIYLLSPAHRKQRIKGKLREVWTATVIAIVLYWIYMIGAFVWKRWGGG